MIRTLPAKQLLRWRDFDYVEPIGGRRGDWQAAAIVSTLVSIFGRKAVNVKDYLLDFGQDTPEAKPAKTWQQLKFIAQQWVAACKPQRRKRGTRNV